MTVRHIFISPVHVYAGHHGRAPGEEPMESVDEVECVAGSGIQGDRYFNFKEDYKGQITLFSLETWEEMCIRFGVFDKGPEVFRRNVVVSGVDLNSLIGQEFEVQGIRFFGTQEAAPCYWMNQAFAEGAEAALKGRGGLRARILSSGSLRVES
ncbi:MAG: MOSC domain-containing protein [Verrucomicrobiae bacterium]|nr:MOSC domain-containing protein [Verrucomicrobiae bacterium]